MFAVAAGYIIYKNWNQWCFHFFKRLWKLSAIYIAGSKVGWKSAVDMESTRQGIGRDRDAWGGKGGNKTIELNQEEIWRLLYFFAFIYMHYIRLPCTHDTSSSSSGARSGTDIGDHASPNISVIRKLQKNLNPYFVHLLPSYKDYQEMLFVVCPYRVCLLLYQLKIRIPSLYVTIHKS